MRGKNDKHEKVKNKAGYTAADASSSAISFYRPRVCARACVCVCLCMCMYVCACVFEWVCSAIPRHCGSANSLISCVCMRVSPLHFVSISQVGNKRFREFEKMGYGRTDRRTDGLTDRRTDRPSYRDARTHLKKCMRKPPENAKVTNLPTHDG